MDKFNKLDKIFIFSAILFGSLILFYPVQYLLIAFVGLIILVFLLAKPVYCYYLIIFTIPFTERLRFLPISFSLNDILILICIFAVGLNILINDKNINLKTSIDKWNIVFLILYFITGITSLSETGVLTFFKFLEAIFIFYITVYLIRTKQTSWSKIIKVFLFTGLFQATLGILQSTTGQFGALNQFQRGYLGYLGIGPTLVWQACGTIGGTGGLSEFLLAILLLIFPFHKSFNKKRKNIIMAILLIAIYMGYTKLSILGLLVCGLVYYNYTAKNRTEATVKVTAICSISAIIAVIMANTSFIKTVDNTMTGRFDIWSYPIAALTSNLKYLWFGSGLNSYWELIDPILPPNIFIEAHKHMLAHNYFLLSIQEMGLIGATILFSFFIFMSKKFLNNFKKYKGSYRNLNMAAFLFVITVFTSSCFGQFYYATYTKVLIYIFFGMVLAKENFLYNSIKKKEAHV